MKPLHRALLIVAVGSAGIGWTTGEIVSLVRIHQLRAQIAAADAAIAAARPSPHPVFGMSSPTTANNFWFDVRTFGAVGNDIHDDTPAIVAANAAAQAVPGGGGVVYFPTPPLAYAVFTEIPVHWPAHWRGDTSTNEQTIIRAHGVGQRSMVELRTTAPFPIQHLENDNTKAIFEKLTFDINGAAAEYGIINNGVEFSEFDHLRFLNSLEACVRTDNIQAGLTISAVTHVGAGPASPTVTQGDTNYQAISQGYATTHVFYKVTTPGPLDTAQFTYSHDGGITYQGISQPISSDTSTAAWDGVRFVQQTGLRNAWLAGNYIFGDTYDFTVTFPPSDFNQTGQTTQGNVRYDSVDFYKCGTIYGTPGAVMPNGYNSVVVGGTVATTAGGFLITGTGTAFMSMLDASSSRFALNYGIPPLGSTGKHIVQTIPLSNFVTAITDGTAAPATVAGMDYIFAEGGGYYHDGFGDTPDDAIYNGICTKNSICYQLAGGNGNLMANTIMISSAIAGMSIGGSSVDNTKGTTLLHPESDSEVSSFGVSYLMSGTTTGSIFDIPTLTTTFSGLAAGWTIHTQGKDSLINALLQSGGTYMPNFTEAIISSPQNLTAPNQQILLPDFNLFQNTGRTSFIFLTSNASYVLTASPVIPQPPIAGLKLYIKNVNPNGGSSITFQQHEFAGSGVQLDGWQLALMPGETLELMSTGVNSPDWVEIGTVAGAYATGNQFGNRGTANGVATTTTNAPTQIIKFNVVNPFAAPGGVVKYDITASTADGLNVGLWLGCSVAWDANAVKYLDTSPACTTVKGISGGVGGVPPFGWTINVDATGTNPYAGINVVGDNAHTVNWGGVFSSRR